MKIIDVPQSGKIGIQVAMPGRYGTVRRAWVPPSNPQTPYQSVIRANFALAARKYDDLTEAQQNAWVAAASGQMAKARLGLTGPLTGLQLFVRVNANLLNAGQEQVDAPPAIPDFAALAITALVISNAGGVIAVKLTAPDNPGENTFLEASAPVNSGVRRTPSLRAVGTCPAPADGTADITALYTARFGVPTVGMRVFVRAYQMTNGYDSPRTVFSDLVPASA